MISPKQRLFAIIGITAALCLAAVFLILALQNRSRQAENTQQTPSPGSAETLPPRTPAQTGTQATTAAPQAAPTSDEQYALQTATIFVERFGTYSNQNNNAHIDDVQILAASSMHTWIESQRQQMSRDYAAVVSRVVSGRVDELQDAAARVLVDVQETRSGSEGQTVTYRSGRVELVRQGSDWLVRGLYWE